MANQELDVDELVNNIFNRSPKPAHSIQLQFVENLRMKEIYEFLLLFFTNGAKYKFGLDKTNPNTKIDITKWTAKEINLMKEYFASISFKLEYDIYHIDKFNKQKIITYKDIKESTLLKDIIFPSQFGNFVYVLKFDYLIPS